MKLPPQIYIVAVKEFEPRHCPLITLDPSSRRKWSYIADIDVDGSLQGAFFSSGYINWWSDQMWLLNWLKKNPFIPLMEVV